MMPTNLASQRCLICLLPTTTARSRGNICSDKPAIGKARSGASRIGQTGLTGTQANGSAAFESGTPGTTYEYNDVRVNALALAALNVWRKPLPQVLKENLMDEIGASNTWRWYGYEILTWLSTARSCNQSAAAGIGRWDVYQRL